MTTRDDPQWYVLWSYGEHRYRLVAITPSGGEYPQGGGVFQNGYFTAPTKEDALAITNRWISAGKRSQHQRVLRTFVDVPKRVIHGGSRGAESWYDHKVQRQSLPSSSYSAAILLHGLGR